MLITRKRTPKSKAAKPPEKTNNIKQIIERIKRLQESEKTSKVALIRSRVELGKELKNLKDAAGHGKWTRALKQLGYHESTTVRLMKLADSWLADENLTGGQDLLAHLPVEQALVPFGWGNQPFPKVDDVELLTLPDGRVLPDACIWHNFMQTELGIDPSIIWEQLLDLPDWPDAEAIPFRQDGSDPHWIRGSHPALKYRGNEIKRHKIWCQSAYHEGLRKYSYTGWKWRISYATHDVQHVKPLRTVVRALNAGLTPAHNHWIVTRYEDGSDNIGYHSDKTKDFLENSYFIVLKLGEPRPFAFRLKAAKGQPKQDPFCSKVLEAGAAVFCRANSEDGLDANSIVEHGVPAIGTPCGVSGSIVSRCISTVIPWKQVADEVKRRQPRKASKTPPRRKPTRTNTAKTRRSST